MGKIKRGKSYGAMQKDEGKRDEYGVRVLPNGTFKNIDDANEWVDMALLAIRSMDMLQGKGSYRSGNRYNTVEELQDAIKQYWQYIIQRNSGGEIRIVPDVEGMALFLGITRMTLRKWEVENTHGFSETVQIAKNAIAAYKKQMGLSGKIPPVFAAIDFNNNHDYVQKNVTEVKLNNPLGEAASVQELMDRYETIEYDEEDGK